MNKKQQAEAVAEKQQRERELDAAFFKTFNSLHGQRVLQHLRGTYVFGILSPDATDAELRHREGQRSIIAEIEQRKERAK